VIAVNTTRSPSYEPRNGCRSKNGKTRSSRSTGRVTSK
jgi:hypothetical protein